ncbi:MAG: hypothetical protein OXF20_03510 [Gammaproteobacteria bacterium]|nr:hypothetical protein [Gammaproteobacteria bacterium]
MMEDGLPTNDHIVRYVKPSMIIEDGTASGTGFCLRENESGLSVNWLEAFGSDKNYQLSEVRRLCRLKRRPSGRFAELNVGLVLSAVSKGLDSLQIIHDRLEANDGFDADPSHAKVMGITSQISHR